MRANFEMSDDDLQDLLSQMKPVPMIMLQCGSPLSIQERANMAWAKLGLKMGFDHMTVRPIGKGDRFFSAETVPCQDIEISPGSFSGCNQSGGDCPVCGK